jgi:hypothetical protein
MTGARHHATPLHTCPGSTASQQTDTAPQSRAQPRVYIPCRGACSMGSRERFGERGPQCFRYPLAQVLHQLGLNDGVVLCGPTHPLIFALRRLCVPGRAQQRQPTHRRCCPTTAANGRNRRAPFDTQAPGRTAARCPAQPGARAFTHLGVNATKVVTERMYVARTSALCSGDGVQASAPMCRSVNSSATAQLSWPAHRVCTRDTRAAQLPRAGLSSGSTQPCVPALVDTKQRTTTHTPTHTRPHTHAHTHTPTHTQTRTSTHRGAHPHIRTLCAYTRTTRSRTH